MKGLTTDAETAGGLGFFTATKLEGGIDNPLFEGADLILEAYAAIGDDIETALRRFLAQFRGTATEFDHVTGRCEGHKPLALSAQLPDIARPVIGFETFHDRRGYAPHWLLPCLAGLSDEALQHEWNIPSAFS